MNRSRNLWTYAALFLCISTHNCGPIQRSNPSGLSHPTRLRCDTHPNALAGSDIADGKPALFLGNRQLHPRVRAITLLPGEQLQLTIVPAGATAPPTNAGAFNLRVTAGSHIEALGWETDQGVIVGDRTGGAGGTSYVAPPTPGIYRLRLVNHARRSVTPEYLILVLTPFDEKRDGFLSGYRIGHYPNELGLVPENLREFHRPVRGFVAVTPGNQDVTLSEHFRLRNFLCKQQPEHFPKYVVIDVRLLDKLERVVDRLCASGYNINSLAIMSGYRTPYYNREIGNDTLWSRHTTGEAADIFIDDNTDGLMDDLDRDGQITRSDAEVLLDLVGSLDDDEWIAGGAATYPGNMAHGPFVHIDTRGYPVRW